MVFQARSPPYTSSSVGVPLPPRPHQLELPSVSSHRHPGRGGNCCLTPWGLLIEHLLSGLLAFFKKCFWRNVCSAPLSIFVWLVCFSIIDLYQLFYTLQMRGPYQIHDLQEMFPILWAIFSLSWGNALKHKSS